jgi:hypothetical protein
MTVPSRYSTTATTRPSLRAGGEAALHPALPHHAAQFGRHGQRDAARAGLEGKVFVQQARGLDDAGGARGDSQPERVGGGPRGAGEDALRVADGIHRHDEVHAVLGDVDRAGGIGHHVVRDRDHVHRVLRVHHAAVELHRGAAGMGVGLDHAPCPDQLLFARREGRVHEGWLLRMDAQLSRLTGKAMPWGHQRQ